MIGTDSNNNMPLEDSSSRPSELSFSVTVTNHDCNDYWESSDSDHLEPHSAVNSYNVTRSSPINRYFSTNISECPESDLNKVRLYSNNIIFRSL